MPKVSVLMPVYNAEKYLKRAIESILSQTFDDWELIIINDGSTDTSRQLIENFHDDRIFCIDNEKNIGLIKTLNKGIKLCNGRYIARMDADDIALPNRLEKQVLFLDYHPDYIMCGTNAIVIDNDERPIGKIRNFANNDLLQINLLFSNPFIHPCIMIKKQILEQNLYDENYKHIEDYDLWCRIARFGKIANLNENLLLYRWHDSNISVLNASVQASTKKEIYRRQLKELDIEPTDDELYAHAITFNLYHLGKKQELSVDKIDLVKAWFKKLTTKNREKELFPHHHFEAYLWSRWCVLCLSQKKHLKAVNPSFAKYNPPTVAELVKIVIALSQK